MKWAVASVGIFVLFMAPMIGILVQPLAPWYLGQRTTATTTGGAPVDIGTLPVGEQLQISDEQRYALAVAAGWSAVQAITMVAISIAEDGSGNPAVLSPRNRDGSFDIGLLQINSAHWNSCGGQQALIVPAKNFACGFGIYQRQGLCAWSTYLVTCGPGHTGSYAAFISRAERAANGAKHQ